MGLGSEAGTPPHVNEKRVLTAPVALVCLFCSSFIGFILLSLFPISFLAGGERKLEAHENKAFAVPWAFVAYCEILKCWLDLGRSSTSSVKFFFRTPKNPLGFPLFSGRLMKISAVPFLLYIVLARI